MANLFDPPQTRALPLVKGQDLVVDFRNKVLGSDPAEYEDYADGVSVTLVIDTTPQTVAEAVIDGDTASCRIESTVTDLIKKGELWRCVVSLPGELDLVAINGKTARFDGAGR